MMTGKTEKVKTRIATLSMPSPPERHRLLVLQPLIQLQQRPAQLVGAAGAEVAADIELADDIAGGTALTLELDPSGVDPAEADSPNGSTSRAISPSWSARA